MYGQGRGLSWIVTAAALAAFLLAACGGGRGFVPDDPAEDGYHGGDYRYEQDESPISDTQSETCEDIALPTE